MIKLDIKKIKEIKKQPIEYKTYQQLTDWLEWDLYQQAIKKGKIKDKNNIITILDEEAKEYVFNIGVVDKSLTNDIILHFLFFFEEIKEINSNSNDIYFNINLNNVCFKDLLYFDNINFYGNVFLSYSIFTKDVYIYRTKFYNSLEFYNSQFLSTINVASSYFYGYTNFSYTFFNKGLNFSSTVEGKFNFSDIVSNYNISFTESNINEEICFLHSNINSNLIFDSVIINNLLLVNNNYKIIEVIIKNSEVLSNIYIMNNNSIDLLNFKDLNISGYLYIYDSFYNGKHILKDSATARILKNEELKKSNNIKALEYEAIEVNLYRKELLKKKNKKLKDFADIFSISLGYIYSSNCQNWIQAFGITLLSIFVIFSIFYTNNLYTFNIFIYLKNIIQDVQTDNYWYMFIEYLIPTKYEHIISYMKLETIPLYKKLFGALVYFVGKISFWYGSVHIVQSFRKFNRVS